MLPKLFFICHYLSCKKKWLKVPLLLKFLVACVQKKRVVLEGSGHGSEVLTFPSFHVFFNLVLICSIKELEFYCIFNGIHINFQLLTRFC